MDRPKIELIKEVVEKNLASDKLKATLLHLIEYIEYLEKEN